MKNKVIYILCIAILSSCGGSSPDSRIIGFTKNSKNSQRRRPVQNLKYLRLVEGNKAEVKAEQIKPKPVIIEKKADEQKKKKHIWDNWFKFNNSEKAMKKAEPAIKPKQDSADQPSKPQAPQAKFIFKNTKPSEPTTMPPKPAYNPAYKHKLDKKTHKAIKYPEVKTKDLPKSGSVAEQVVHSKNHAQKATTHKLDTSTHHIESKPVKPIVKPNPAPHKNSIEPVQLPLLNTKASEKSLPLPQLPTPKTNSNPLPLNPTKPINEPKQPLTTNKTTAINVESTETKKVINKDEPKPAIPLLPKINKEEAHTIKIKEEPKAPSLPLPPPPPLNLPQADKTTNTSTLDNKIILPNSEQRVQAKQVSSIISTEKKHINNLASVVLTEQELVSRSSRYEQNSNNKDFITSKRKQRSELSDVSETHKASRTKQKKYQVNETNRRTKHNVGIVGNTSSRYNGESTN
jgi:hypothetical protein